MTSTDPSDPSRLVGAVLGGRWRLTHLLGQGGMGAVFAAEGLQGQGVRAVKLLHPEFRKEQAIVERFFAEAQTSARLSHPGVVRVEGAATAEDGTPYLVMELLEGRSLEQVVGPGRPLPLEQASFVLERLLEALQYAHQAGVVHRDLKPENLFLVPQSGGGTVVKIVDFGIAKVMDAAGGMGSKTRTGMMLGTPGYMSPEQMRNAKLSDPRSDLWSVGVIAFEMLAGVDPFPADDPFAKLMRVLSHDPPPIGSVRPDLSPLQPFFARALVRDPAGRFQSAADMAAGWRAAIASLRPAPAPAQAAVPPPPAGGTVALPHVAGPATVGSNGVQPRPAVAGGTAQLSAPYQGSAPTRPSAGVTPHQGQGQPAPYGGPGGHQGHRAPAGPSGHQGAPGGWPAQAPPPGAFPGAPPGARLHDRPEVVTQLSQLRPAGAPTPPPTLQPDQVRFVTAPPPGGLHLKTVWVVAFALACVVVGVGIGLLIAYR
jgi:serine/threonine-protein kinase